MRVEKAERSSVEGDTKHVMQSAAFRRHSTMALQDFGATDEKANHTFSTADFLSNKKNNTDLRYRMQHQQPKTHLKNCCYSHVRKTITKKIPQTQ